MAGAGRARGPAVLFLFLFLSRYSRAALFVCARRESRGEKASAGGNGCVASDFFSSSFLGRGQLMPHIAILMATLMYVP
jgi:hypothetical protein